MHERNKNNRKYFDHRLGAMKQERQSFDAHWKELAKFVQPRRGRFLTTDRNKGDKRHQAIINSHATWALRTAKTGLFAGTMNPARPWFRLETDDPGLMESGPVKAWLSDVENLMRDVYDEGNLYTMAPVVFGELLLFATGCMLHVDDFQDVARFYALTVGSYSIAQNQRQVVDTLAHELQMTVFQLVGEFGLGNVSSEVRRQWDLGNYEIWFPVVHFIEPNPDFDPRRPGGRFKAWRSVKYQSGGAVSTDLGGEVVGRFAGDDKFLSRSGFDRFPAYCPRWEVTGEDIYGTDCPGMTTLGDIKGLQIKEKRKGQGIAKMVNPALKGPPSLPAERVSSLPGGYTQVTGTSGEEKLSSIYTTDPRIQELVEDMREVKEQISKNFLVDLFQAISDMQGIQPRNQFELIQRKEESLVQLGPALGRVHGEWLEDMVENTFEQLARADEVTGDVLPEAPPELQGKAFRVRFISSLAQAQNAVATGNIDRLAAYVSGLAGVPGYEEVTDKFDADQSVDEYSHLIGAPARLVVPDDVVAERRQARAEALEQQRQQDMMLELAKAGAAPAATAATANLEEDNIVSRSVENLQQAVGGSQ